jgi:hypothetical protein
MLPTSVPSTLSRLFKTSRSERVQTAPYLYSKTNDREYQTVVDEFNSAYWSGVDVSIFFNDMYIDDIVNIQYQVSENTLPLYSYGDYTYRSVARGSRIIQGSFSINFKRSFYIPLVLKELKNIKAGSSKEDVRTSNKMKSSIISQFPSTPEEILGASRHNSTGGFNYAILDEIRQKNIEKFWGAEDRSVETSARNTNSPLYDVGSDGITIYIKYGDIKLNIDERAVFGKIGTGLPSKTAGTIEALDGVQINVAGKSIDDSGRNILEIYSFIARDLIPETGKSIDLP